MSIQPNRVLARIIDQVERSDWQPLDAEIRYSPDGSESLRCFSSPRTTRYATPFHFWVHALRDDLAARSKSGDLVGSAGYALCRRQSLASFRDRVSEVWKLEEVSEERATVYEMQANECRRSSVALIDDRLYAFFWQHGFDPSWRQRA